MIDRPAPPVGSAETDGDTIGELRLPRILHSIHLGPDPLTPEAERRIGGWVAAHPGWVHHHWTSETLARQTDFGPHAAAGTVEMTELIKYQVLLRHGGIYFDFDIECLQSLEPLLDDLDVFFVQEVNGEISGTVIGAVPSHPLIALILKNVQLGLSGALRPRAGTPDELLRRAIADHLGSNQEGIRLEVADTGKELGGLYAGHLALFAAWVLLQPASSVTSAGAEPFAVDHRFTSPALERVRHHDDALSPDRIKISGAAPIESHSRVCLAIVIPTITRADLLRENLETLLPQLAHEEHLYIIDNGRQGIAVDSGKVTVLEQPVNLGVAASWNLGLRLGFAKDAVTHVLVLNDDICLARDQLEAIRRNIREHPDKWFYVGAYYWSVWAIARQAAHAMQMESGEIFDERFYPAYFEDNDFYYRFNALFPSRYLGDIAEFLPNVRRNSMTITKEPRLNVRFAENQRYYVQKWGGPPGHEILPVSPETPGGGPAADGAGDIWSHYRQVCATPSDIYEHLPTLKSYAEECCHVTEFGVRTVVSTWAFLAARPDVLRSYDILVHENVAEALRCAAQEDVDFKFIEQDVHADGFEIEETELLFIDTLHTYTALSTELSKHSHKVTKYLIFHDTITFGHSDEGGEGGRGLVPAIEEFLQNNSGWHRHEEFSNNNGLTILKRRQTTNPLARYFEYNEGRLIHKWDHYFDIYHRHFARFRNRNVTILEIGVSHGGSLQMWKNYFGESARIVGVDIDERCRTLKEPGIEIYIGNQEDRGFWRQLKKRLPRLDIVIDDGGHTMTQMRTAFEELYEAVRAGGVYLVEDTHTCYWEEFGGGRNRPESFIEYAKNLIDELNAHHHRQVSPPAIGRFTRTTSSIVFYDSVVVFEKGNPGRPFASHTGQPSF